MNPISHTTCFTINPKITYTVIDGEAVIMAAEDDQLYATNTIATELLQLLEKTPSTIPMMQAYIMEQFEIGAAECLSDIENLMTTLLKAKLVTTVNPQP